MQYKKSSIPGNTLPRPCYCCTHRHLHLIMHQAENHPNGEIELIPSEIKTVTPIFALRKAHDFVYSNSTLLCRNLNNQIPNRKRNLALAPRLIVRTTTCLISDSFNEVHQMRQFAKVQNLPNVSRLRMIPAATATASTL
jgi:hypothetical protein